MKGIFITILALVAAPAVMAGVDLSEVDLSQVQKVTTENSGSVAARAVAEVENAQLEARQNVQFCALPPSVFVGNTGGAEPANLDGSCISLGACNNVGGEAFTGATGCNSGDCCIKRDCAGANSNSACLNPQLRGDQLSNGQAGRFVNGACPTGLRCFQLTRGAL
ncbi:MAG: hypothetical protein M1820_004789 [Bogoriella megaspora]|nr:MAG: hypothetical protein M1820_004789 [Bogoriella megaspora]